MNSIIPQYFEHFENLKNFKNNLPTNNLNLSIEPFYVNSPTLHVENLLNFQRLFILAEPGYGKTTLLKDLIPHLKEQSKKVQIFYGKDNLEIELNEDVEFLIFDALDESKDIIPTFLKLLEVVENKKTKLIISNRTHYIDRIEHLLQKNEFEFIRLLPFNKHQIVEFFKTNLEGIEVHDELLNKVIENSKSGTGNSILSTPRYLNEFCVYVNRSRLKAEEIKM